jgi:Abnormal spindle-like microcephaly-assoc'd, ASPM-SPD-2-Hydin
LYRKLAAALLSSVVLVFVTLSGTAQTNTKQASDAAGGARGSVRTIQGQIAPLSAPFSLAAGPDNQIYFAVSRTSDEGTAAAMLGMSNRIFSVVPGQKAIPFAGTGSFGFLGDGGLAADAEFELSSIALGNSNLGLSSAPAMAPAPPHSGIVVGADGTLFVADTQNSTIRTISGLETSEPMITRSLVGKWAGASDIELIAPTALAMDAAGNLYISDIKSNSILAYRNNSISILAHVISPGAIAVNAAGTRLYAASLAAGKVFEIDSSLNRSSNGSSIRTLLSTPAPSGLAVDAAGNIFIADASENTIRRFAIQSGSLTVVAGTGVAGYSGDGGAALRAAFNSPADLAFDHDGNLFVSDAGNRAIREVIEIGQPDQSTTVVLGPASSGQFANVATGGASSAQVFTLTNSSGVSLTGLAVTIAGADPLDFSQTNTCGSSLAASATCNINVVFNPTNAGTRSATLQVTDSDPSSPQTAALSGFGDTFYVSAQTGALTSITIRQGTTATFNLVAAPDQTFTGTVTLQCPANLPTSTTCALTPATVTWPSAPGASQNFTAAFTTTKKTITAIPPTPRFPARPVGLVALGLLALMWIAAGIVEKRNPLGWNSGRTRTRRFAFALGALALLLAGCNNTPAISYAPSPTPTGTYTLTVAGEAQNASRGVTLTLDVEAAP